MVVYFTYTPKRSRDKEQEIQEGPVLHMGQGSQSIGSEAQWVKETGAVQRQDYKGITSWDSGEELQGMGTNGESRSGEQSRTAEENREGY